MATSLMMEMSKVFKYEKNRQRTFLEEVKGLIPSCTSVRNPPISDSTMQVKIDNQEYNLVNWEVKCEMVQISSEPTAQNISYFVHLQKGNNRTARQCY